MGVKRALIGALLVLGACGSPEVVSAGSDTAVPSCSDVPSIHAPDEAYSDTPRYVANEMPTEEVQAWAQSQSGFEDLWIDRERNGWLTLAFSEDGPERQAAVREAFPGVGVVVVEVPWKMNELLDLQMRVQQAILEHTVEVSSSVSMTKGVVEVNVMVLTDEIRQAVKETFAGERICLDGGDPSDFPPPEPQPEAGDGWRLLAGRPQTGEAYRTGIATDPVSLRALWSGIGLDEPAPEVDFNREVVIWFGAAYGSTCPELRLDDVIVEGNVVYPEIVLAVPHMMCTADLHPFAFLVAVERPKLPKGPFAIKLEVSDNPTIAATTFVDVDLTLPGSVAAPNQIGPDPDPPAPRGIEAGDYLEPGFPMGPYDLYVHCGIEWLGEFNDYTWRTDEEIPKEWGALKSEDQTVEVELLLSTDPEPVIEASAGGVSVTYHITDEPDPGCD